jgi:TonB family protein
MTLPLKGWPFLSRKKWVEKNLLPLQLMKPSKSIPLFLYLFLLLNMASYAQDTLKQLRPTRRIGLPNPLPVFPRFPGGNDSLAIFIKNHTHYPKKARKHNISGNVEVYFTVTADGSIKNPKVLKPIGYGCDEEAIRVVNLMPKWIPATIGRDSMQLDYHVIIPFGKQK